jgi:hypothetical protein
LPPHETFQLHLGKAITDLASSRHDVLPCHARGRVEIEDQAVRLIGLIRASAPGVEFEGVHLHQFEYPGDIVDIDVLGFASILFRQGDGFHMLAELVAVVFLEETLAGGALWTTDQRERTSPQFRQHA